MLKIDEIKCRNELVILSEEKTNQIEETNYKYLGVWEMAKILENKITSFFRGITWED